MKFTPATVATPKNITIEIINDLLVVSHSWTHLNDREIREGLLDARFDLQQSTWNFGKPYTVTGTRAELERLKAELNSAYGLLE